MDAKIAAMLEQANPELRMRTDYSGRGMYGKTTAGVACDSWNDVLCAVGNILQEVVNDIHQECFEEHEEMEQLATALQEGFHSDQMGRGIIIY